MTNLRRFLWGGIGALAPILATLLILEGDIIAQWIDDILDDDSALKVAGYAVRVIGLFVVGGLWASVHKSERDPKKLFQLGIVAPAMITGMISASNVTAVGGPPALSAGIEPSAVVRMSPAPNAPTVAAGPTSSRSVIQNREEPRADPPPPNPEPIKSFIRGLLGRP